ncbi:MAG: flagellar biosynthesis anti-sigma factor FlgM [Gammaproteobacteria bacterium]|nr:flagellar biosynthesis anti-sigma factor FlgM [Gammaproteobacteria bacterium]
MAINNITGYTGTQATRSTEGSQPQVSRSEPTVSQSETGTPSSIETVSLSDTSVQLRSLENTIANLPVVDTSRVEALKKAIDEGSYQIDSGRVADKMISFERQLMGEVE